MFSIEELKKQMEWSEKRYNNHIEYFKSQVDKYQKIENLFSTLYACLRVLTFWVICCKASNLFIHLNWLIIPIPAIIVLVIAGKARVCKKNSQSDLNDVIEYARQARENWLTFIDNQRKAETR